MQSRSNCSNISSSYATVVGYYGDIDKNVATPGYALTTDSSVVLAESALGQQSTAPDHTATSSVAMATVTEHVHRANEGILIYLCIFTCSDSAEYTPKPSGVGTFCALVAVNPILVTMETNLLKLWLGVLQF